MKMKAFYALISIFCIIIFVSKISYGENEDKGKIAFTANLSGNWDLFIMDEDGSNAAVTHEKKTARKSQYFNGSCYC